MKTFDIFVGNSRDQCSGRNNLNLRKLYCDTHTHTQTHTHCPSYCPPLAHHGLALPPSPASAEPVDRIHFFFFQFPRSNSAKHRVEILRYSPLSKWITFVPRLYNCSQARRGGRGMLLPTLWQEMLHRKLGKLRETILSFTHSFKITSCSYECTLFSFF